MTDKDIYDKKKISSQAEVVDEYNKKTKRKVVKKLFVLTMLFLIAPFTHAGVRVGQIWNSYFDGVGYLKEGGKYCCVSLAPTVDKCTIVKYQTAPDGKSELPKKIYGNFFRFQVYEEFGQYYIKLTSVYPQAPFERTGAPEEVFPLFIYYGGEDVQLSLRNMTILPPLVSYGYFAWDGYTTYSTPEDGGTSMVIVSDEPLFLDGYLYVGGFINYKCTLQFRPIILSKKGMTWFEEYWANFGAN